MSTVPCILVIGGCGELGRAVVCASLQSPYFKNVVATYNKTTPSQALKTHTSTLSTCDSSAPRVISWVQLDCQDHDAMKNVLGETKPDAIVYCAVPKHGGANGKGGDEVRRGIVDDVVNCAKMANDVNVKRFIALSTDLVFDGTLLAGKRYTESDVVNPTNMYAKYKVEMENALAGMPNVIIARTSLILSLGDESSSNTPGKGVQFVLDALAGRGPGQQGGAFTMFTDELRCMSFSDDLGNALVELCEPSSAHTQGLIHLVSDEVQNRYELARYLAKWQGTPELVGKTVQAGLSAESGMNRPLNCALSSELLRKTLSRTVIRGLSKRLERPEDSSSEKH